MAGDRLIRAAHHALIAFFVIASMLVLSAQAVVDPRYVEFNASADHNTLAADGSPIVASYALSIYPQGSTTTFATLNLGKPAPDVNNVIRVDFLALLTTLPVPGVNYEARVTALGPGGATASTASNGFSFSAPCAPSISPGNRTVTASATTGTVSVTAGTTCAWTAATNAPGWLTISAGGIGTGNGTVSYSVAANTSTSQRVGTLTIAGQTFTLTQSGQSCAYSITPTSASIVAGGGNGSSTVTTTAGCAWTATSNAPGWLTISTGASGTGGGMVTFSATANTATQTRQGTLTIAGQTFTVNQAALGCSYTLTSTSTSTGPSATTGSTSVNAPAGCAWTAASNAPSWLTITGGASGNGNGSISFSVASNASATQRVGTLTIGGQTYTVTQTGVACTISLTPVSSSVAAGGGAGSTAVTAPAGCAWTASTNAPSWLTISAGASGNGNGTVSFSAAANTVTQTRQGTLTIGGETFTVDQAAAPCTYSISPSSTSVVAGGGSASATVTSPAGCAWTASSNAPAWLSVTAGGSGSGNGTVTFAAAANTVTQPRQGTLTIAGQTFTVNQSALGCAFTLAPASASVGAAAATGSASVTTQAGCAWTAATNAPGWLTVTGGASGSGSGTVSFSVSANPQAQARQGTLTIGGQTFTVIQAASACTFSISPTSQGVPSIGGAGSAAVTTGAGCAWTAQSNVGWITLAAGSTGTGPGTVLFDVAQSNASAQRTGTMTIAGRTFTVTQAANTGCQYSLSQNGRNVPPGGGSYSVSLTAGSGCVWTATSNVPWITLNTFGSGSQTVTMTVAPNTSGSTRTGTVTIANLTYTVTQNSGTQPANPRNLRVVIAINGGS